MLLKNSHYVSAHIISTNLCFYTFDKKSLDFLMVLFFSFSRGHFLLLDLSKHIWNWSFIIMAPSEKCNFMIIFCQNTKRTCLKRILFILYNLKYLNRWKYFINIVLLPTSILTDVLYRQKFDKITSNVFNYPSSYYLKWKCLPRPIKMA